VTLSTYYPITTFKNRNIVDITKNVKIAMLLSPWALADYQVPDGDRPETVAFDVYDEAQLAWLVLLPNVKLDPYYGWPMPQRDFEAWMKKKYGTLAVSLSTKLFYEHSSKDITISVDTYNHASTLTHITASEYNVVYAYDYYDRVNNNNRHIKLVPPEAVPGVISKLETLF
jgi:hypothetical protein|tara:strand:- start:1191 stop:1703 length:513 start_codon:yes stop_codon:yes gene_type:complete